MKQKKKPESTFGLPFIVLLILMLNSFFSHLPFQLMRQRKARYQIKYNDFNTRFVRVTHLIFTSFYGLYALPLTVKLLFFNHKVLVKQDYFGLLLCDVRKLLRRNENGYE